MILKKRKEVYNKRLEGSLEQNAERNMMTGMKIITGFKGKRGETDGCLDSSNGFNKFSCEELCSGFSSSALSHIDLTHPLYQQFPYHSSTVYLCS